MRVIGAHWRGSCGEQLQDFERPEKIIIGVMLAIITAVTVMGNTLVVIAVCVVKKLRQPSNYLLVSLAVADLSVAIVVMPFVIMIYHCTCLFGSHRSHLNHKTKQKLVESTLHYNE
uniref:G-protein coupled receptors family 1 profile domain-containing protein n=1 Tax=Acanthochromis polyacanthus TaxID=80966 RepID=A0A3Q1GI42_9TELE